MADVRKKVVNLLKNKAKLEGAMLVNYNKTDVINSWKQLSHSERKKYMYFSNEDLVNKIISINSTIFSENTASSSTKALQKIISLSFDLLLQSNVYSEFITY